nr:Fic family protein [Bifidobacterium simiarum]
MRRERDERASGGLYHATQVEFAFNSNHMEGSTLSADQTAQLFSTGSMAADGPDDVIRADDVVETTNHFRAFDWMLDRADDPVDAAMVCELHRLLKRGTMQESDPSRNVGGWKVVPNVIDGLAETPTVPPEDVPAAMDAVFRLYAGLRDDPFEVARAHWMFESTHPFSDGNGRVGRLVMFKELLRLDSIPPVVRDPVRAFYLRGLSRFAEEPGWLTDTLLSERDAYRALVERLAPGRIRYSYVDSWDPSRVPPASNPFLRGSGARDGAAVRASLRARIEGRAAGLAESRSGGRRGGDARDGRGRR